MHEAVWTGVVEGCALTETPSCQCHTENVLQQAVVAGNTRDDRSHSTSIIQKPRNSNEQTPSGFWISLRQNEGDTEPKG